jgi:DNA polymerase-3 subunit delta
LYGEVYFILLGRPKKERNPGQNLQIPVKRMNYYNQIIKEIQDGNIRSTYLLFGEEILLADDLIRRIKEKFLEQPEAELNYFLRYASDQGADELISLNAGMGLFSQKKLIILKEADLLKQKDLDRLVHVFKKPDPNICLILQANITSLFQTRLKKIENEVATVNLLPLRPSELQKFVKEEFQKYSREITPEAVDILLFMVGHQLSDLAGQIRNIALLGEENEKVTKDIVEKVAGVYVTQDVFELSKLIATENQSQSAFVLSHLLQSGISPQQILYQLYRHFSVLFQIQGHLRIGINRSDTLAREMKIYPKYLSEYLEQAGLWNLRRLRKVFRYLYEADRNLKNNTLEPQIVLDILSHKILNC